MGRIGRLGEEYDTRYFLNDHLGSVRAIVNQDGVVTAEYDYMPYGMQHKNSSLATSDTNEFRYNGKELQSRFCVDLYDSQARLQGMNARFNSIDPLAGEMPDISPYAYCAGNPIKNIDPDGMQQITSDVNDKPENKREKEEYNKQLEWREQFERSFWFRPSQPLNTPTTDKDEEDKPLSHKIFTSGAVFALGASQIDSPVIGPGDVAAVFILLGSAAAAGITDLIMEFSQHGKNDGRLSQEELEILLEKKAQGTLTGKEKKKLNSHEKNKKNRHSRQSKDIKKSKKK